MSINLQDYISRPFDTLQASDLAHKLRQLTPEECFAFVLEYIKHDVVIGLRIANKFLRERRYFEQLLETGILAADASSIKYWFESCLPRVGARRAVNIIDRLSVSTPNQVMKVMYWAKILIGECDQAQGQRLRELEESLKHKITSLPQDNS
jgi:hypothetical protein